MFLPALALGSLALPLLVLEGFLALRSQEPNVLDHWKTRGYYGPDPDLIFFPKANVENVWTTDEFVEVVRTNSRGLRGAEIRERADFEARIVIIGDSMTFGHGVAEDESYPSVLEALYREAGRRVDVVNAGVKGFGIDQTYKHFLTRLRDLAPDLLILSYYANDLKDNVLHPLYRLDGGGLVSLDATDDPIYTIGRVNELLPEVVRNTRTARWLTARLIRSTTLELSGDLTPRERFRIEQRKIVIQVEDLVRTGRRDGFDFLFLAIPYRDPGLEARYGWLRHSLKKRARLLDLSTEPGWHARQHELFFRRDFHMTAAGHARVAATLFEDLNREGF